MYYTHLSNIRLIITMYGPGDYKPDVAIETLYNIYMYSVHTCVYIQLLWYRLRQKKACHYYMNQYPLSVNNIRQLI